MEHASFWRSLGAVLLACAVPFAAGAVPAHYIVMKEDSSGRVRIVHRTVVEMDALPTVEATGQWDGHGNRMERRLSVRAEQGGAVVYRTDVATSRYLRHEFSHGHDLHDDALHLEAAERVYVVRLPLLGAGARALVSRPNAGLGAAVMPKGEDVLLEIDLAAPAAMPKAASADVFTLQDNGPSSNRLDLLVLGDGYTAEQRDKFRQDATQAMQSFFQASPYAEYKPYVNVKALFVPSSQAGADKPSCPETPGSPVVEVDTAFDARFCSSGIRRLVTVNPEKVYQAAAAVPGYDKIVILVNDAEYGGSGGGFIVATLHPNTMQTVQHEFGHTFTLLADEYESAYPGFPACSDAPGSTTPCEANVSDRTAPVKWERWLEPGTPVPSAKQLGDSRAAGVWEGARYVGQGMYRQCYQGMMRDASAPFCRVDSEAFVLRLYSAGWGAPAQGIVPIEPGTRSPAAESLDVAAGSAVALAARVVAPTSGVLAEWRIDGGLAKSERVASAAEARFSYVALSGAHTVTLTVIDDSLLLLQPRAWTVSWRVNGGGGTGGGSQQLAAAPSQLAFGAQAINTSSRPQRVTLTNSGSGSITPAVSASGPFAVAHACGTLAPGASCTVDVVFSPVAEGGFEATLSVSASAASVALSGSGERSLATHYYRSILRRAPDAQGHAFWNAEVARMGRLGADSSEAWYAMSAAFFGSAEYTAFGRDDGGFVDDLYGTFFNRAPDASGRSYWMGQLAQGLPRQVLLASFMFSPEFAAFTRSIVGSSASRAEVSVVIDFYRGLLARLPDDGGFDYWVRRFRAAQCSGSAAVNAEVEAISSQFLGSAEYAQRNRATAQLVGDLYNAFLRRGGDLDGVRYWVGELQSGRRTPQQARAAFLASPEFQARVAAVIRQGCSL